MALLENQSLTVQLNTEGIIESIYLKNDPHKMNWLIGEDYLKELGYPDANKLLGYFTIEVNGVVYDNYEKKPEIKFEENRVIIQYIYEKFAVSYVYCTAGSNEALMWNIKLTNLTDESMNVNTFYLWFSLAYIMFRDKNVIRNMNQSCAVYSFISDDFTKFAAVKRDNQGPHLGIYNTKGKTVSLGSFCRFENKFLEHVSPSLDGILFHSLVLASTGLKEGNDSSSDWIYRGSGNSSLKLTSGSNEEWEYAFIPFAETSEFYKHAFELGQPIMDYTPVTIKGEPFSCKITAPERKRIVDAWIEQRCELDIERISVTDQLQNYQANEYRIEIRLMQAGEKKLVIELDDGKQDFVVFNVFEPIKNIIETRIDYLCQFSYIDDEQSEDRYAFQPLSNQGESLGKLNLILKKNIMAGKDLEQIQKVEKSAIYYIKKKWFIEDSLWKPQKIYGGFYRIFDFDYIAHVYFLLSKFDRQDLLFHEPDTYLEWTAEIMIMRFDENLHQDEREKKESKLTGVFTLYIQELLNDLKVKGFNTHYEKLSQLWKEFIAHLKRGSLTYQGAITEHFYDNAGFGPTCEALCLANQLTEAEKYGELILANIGISNDYRSQNPDRWWEALAFMVHSLWGGLVSNSALVGYEHFKNKEYLLAAYRSMMPVFFCYDWNAYSTLKTLKKGEAASTYCVSNPNMNKPQLSHNRFGQSVFLEDGEVFGNATGDDWDMGEELVAYLNGFGMKTYLYYEGDEIKCMNGWIEKDNEQYIITSYAAYPKEYYFYEENLSFIAKDNEVAPKVVLNSSMNFTPYNTKDSNGANY